MTLIATIPDGAHRAMRLTQLHRFVRCWRLTRTDGTILRFTESATPIDVQGETFDPTDGMSTSALQQTANLQEQNFEAQGILSATAIDHDDLRAGLYQDCRIDTLLVDWEQPELGSFSSQTFWIEKVTFDGVKWKSDIIGIAGWMRRNQGSKYTRSCRFDLGDQDCKVVLVSFTESAAVTGVLSQRIEFNTSVSAQPDDHFTYGQITWTSGANAGVISEVAEHDLLNGRIKLRIATPYDIAASDGFSIIAGCDKQRSTCKDKFSNLVNHGGFPFIPGADRLIEIPGQK